MNKLFNAQVKTPLSWYGGKTMLLDFVLGHFPRHEGYCEVFGGSGAALFAKSPAVVEVYNDLNPGLANFFRVLKEPEHAFKLYMALRLTPNSRQEHAACRENYPATDPVEWARQFVVLTRQSYSSIFYHTSWAYSISARGSSFHSSIELLPAAISRLSKVTIENTGFAQLFGKYDGPDWLWYLDPPYLDSTRRAKKVYAHEMTEDDHRHLLRQIQKLKGMVVLSGYPSSLYQVELRDWHRVTKTVPCYSSETTKRSGRLFKPSRTECLWLNPAAWNRLNRRRSRSLTSEMVQAEYQVASQK